MRRSLLSKLSDIHRAKRYLKGNEVCREWDAKLNSLLDDVEAGVREIDGKDNGG